RVHPFAASRRAFDDLQLRRHVVAWYVSVVPAVRVSRRGSNCSVHGGAAMSTVTKPEHIDLTLTGMTCAACAARIEKKLNTLDGVTATVNYATEKAAVAFDPSVQSTDDLLVAVESIGYGAQIPASATDYAQQDDADDRRRRGLLRRLVVATVLGVPVLVISMASALQFKNWQWVVFALATPVATWAAFPFHSAALKNLRQAEASMDTLVSTGVLAAYGWST